ncbi:hypothetical protein [Paracoccus sp. R86501]|uniref:hypothetical protein n=1 Tax=Paracoccus sp. R86501 TaxID=3101711 RepID=UPI00366D1EC3
MIRNSWISRAAILALGAATLAGCTRMPPTTPVQGVGQAAGYGYAPTTGYAQTTGYAPATGYGAPQPVAQPAMAPTPMPIPVSDPAPTPAQGITGLTERKPDLCGAAKIADAVGKPSSVIPTLGLTRDYRIVEYRGIEAQVYVPNRVVFRLDEAGTITSIDCG